MAALNQEKKDPQKKKLLVVDTMGTRYELLNKIGEGGQGSVWATNYDNVLAKVSNERNPEKLHARRKKLSWIMRQNLDGLHIAKPVALIDKPNRVVGYIMELMDGLVPLKDSLEESFNALTDGQSLEGYVKTGGLERRLKLLQELAKTLADVHARGFAYGDLSPDNIFVSHSVEYSEVWLIDCDNLSVNERLGQDYIFTPGFAAPEIIKQLSGINVATDIWSFSVIAFKLLTLCHPFESGFRVEDGDPDVELESAYKGELPWIYDENDDSNAWAESGVPLALVSTKKIRSLFDNCFSEGRSDPGSRPSMAEWSEALDEAISVLRVCENETDCGVHFIYNKSAICTFCDAEQVNESCILLMQYYFNNSDVCEGNRLVKTGACQTLNVRDSVQIRLAPAGTTHHKESPLICTLSFDVEHGIIIQPEPDNELHLLKQSTARSVVVTRKMRLNFDKRGSQTYQLHINQNKLVGEGFYQVWTFKW